MLAEIVAKNKKPEKSLEEIVPKEYHDLLDVFSEKTANTLPVHQPYDCAIDLIPGAPLPPRAGVIPLSDAKLKYFPISGQYSG